MKNLILFFFTCSIFFFSCTDSKEQNEEFNLQFLEQIANDPAYVAYQKVKNTLSIGIAGKQFELAAINNAINKQGDIYICLIPETTVSQYLGGKEYLRLNCELDTALDVLIKKHPKFSKLTGKELMKLMDLSAENGLLPSSNELVEIIKNESLKTRQ
jgi:hypothetical protein